jgi:hypothetical protein
MVSTSIPVASSLSEGLVGDKTLWTPYVCMENVSKHKVHPSKWSEPYSM